MLLSWELDRGCRVRPGIIGCHSDTEPQTWDSRRFELGIQAYRTVAKTSRRKDKAFS
jgi:hypothetical protein